MDRVVQGERKPTIKTTTENSWISILVEGGKIIGSYIGAIYTDEMERDFSADSYITISPEYQGRGLCREFAAFTYERLLSLYQVEYIIITVSSTLGAGACRCYVRAAKDLGLRTFGSLSEEHEYLYREVQDCNLGDLKFLVFTTLKEVDQVMTAAFDREEEEG